MSAIDNEGCGSKCYRPSEAEEVIIVLKLYIP